MRSWDWRNSIDDLRKQTEVHVDEAWQARIVARMHEGRRRRFLRPALVLSLAGLAFAVWGVSTRAPTETLQFDANATGTRMSPDAEAVVVEQTPERTRVDLRRGSVHFDIGHTGRAFQVEAAGVTVTVLGTSFTVTRQNAEVTVAVRRGRVRVQSRNDLFELRDGQERSVKEERSVKVEGMAAVPSVGASDERPTPEEARPNSPSAAKSTTTVPALSPVTASKRSGRTSARAAGDSEAAVDNVEMLMRAADEARQAQDWSAALADYGRVVAQHGHDSRAGLASFSMGRILLYQLHRPAQAAHAFADARRLPLSPSLARESLTREIEAWHAAEDDAQARALSEEYIRLYSEAGAPGVVRELIHKP